jgi:hypothetical protein
MEIIVGSTLATMFTISTYGTWLRGDARGWVDNGIIFPADPALKEYDSNHMKHEPYYFPRGKWMDLGQAMGIALRDRMDARIYAWTVQSWHAHGVIGSTRKDIADVIKCVKDAARWNLNIDRPIWAADYDKRWCFDWRTVANRIDYVERHNLRNGWTRKPFDFIRTPPELERPN